MTDLPDLDRRAAEAMGLKLCTIDHKVVWSEPCRAPLRHFHPKTDAHDCREFMQWGLRNEGWTLDLYVGPGVADATVGPGSSVDCGIGEATKEEYGPTYDLVAQVLAMLDALEKDS